MQGIPEARKRAIEKRISTSRLTVTSFCRFFGHLVGKTRAVVAEPWHKVATAAVSPDGYVYYNPDFVDTLTDAELAGLTIHETMHPALLCWRRQGPRKAVISITHEAHECSKCDGKPAPAGFPPCDHKERFTLWNLAHDLSFNPDIQELADKCRAKGKIKLPKCAAIDPAYKGWSAVRIYDDLEKKIKKGDNDGGGGAGSLVGKYGEGGGIGDDLRPDLSQSKEGKAAAAGDKASQQKIQNQWRVSVIAAAIAHERKHGRGHLPGGISKLVAELTESKVSWVEVLSQWVGENGNKQDFTYRRPRRRFDPNVLFLPSVQKYGVDDVLILWDTSGSMNGRERDILSEVQAICEDLGLSLRIICCDTQVHSDVRDVKTAIDMIGKIKGGGGSDFTPAFDLLEDECYEGVVVAFTDGHIGVPQTKPPLIKDVLWCIEPKGKGFGDVDPTQGRWGQVLVMEDQ
jgi:predicted metal-dependent peptidase